MIAATPLELIEKKRDGRTHTRSELRLLVDAFVSGEVPDYQMSAWMMAAYLNGLDEDETVWLTQAMADSGERVDLSAIPGVKVDKHSTGGVGDTTTLVLAPLVASCGVPVAKMSGRGLGHTGGTLDKLESIPGMRVELSREEFVSQVREVGCAVVAQSADIDPADRKMYALRDVTGTVPSVPLIVSSIISKKVAGGADAVVLDVKVGSGAFMKDVEHARCLASELERVGDALGREVDARLTDMDQPLGMAVGNALEVVEAIETLSGEGPPALTELCIRFAALMLVRGGAAPDERSARDLAVRAISSGDALRAFERWVQAQGGDPAVAEDTGLLPRARAVREVRASRSGFVSRTHADAIGSAAAALGAGRGRKEDAIDPAAGVVLDVRVGDEVSAGDRIATLYASDPDLLDEAEHRIGHALELGDTPPAPRPLFLDE